MTGNQFGCVEIELQFETVGPRLEIKRPNAVLNREWGGGGGGVIQKYRLFSDWRVKGPNNAGRIVSLAKHLLQRMSKTKRFSHRALYDDFFLLSHFYEPDFLHVQL